MVTELNNEYAAANKPVVFFEQAIFNPLEDTRKAHWWAAFGYGSAGFPYTMVDSGYRYKSGHSNFKTDCQIMINDGLNRLPGAVISATVDRTVNTLQFVVNITNKSGSMLSYNSNKAQVYAIIYEEVDVNITGNGLTGHYVRDVKTKAILTLADNQSATYSLQTASLSGVNWDKLHPVVFIDYRPGGYYGKYDILQAAVETATPPGWQVTPGTTGNGAISPSTAQTVADNGTTSFTLTPQANNHIVNVAGSCPAGTLVGNTYTTGQIVADCSVTAVFAVNSTQNSNTIIPPLQLLLLGN